MTQPNFIELQKKLDYKFSDPMLLQKSMTHSSSNESYNYEKLEFLGDVILSVVISTWLFEDFPADKEGTLAKKRAKLVSKNSCMKLAKDMGLEHYIIVNLNNDNLDISTTSIMSDVFESLLGAIFLDGGLEEVIRVLLPFKSKLWLDIADNIDNPKSQLQEWTQAHKLGLPIYKDLSEFYQNDQKYFSISVTAGNISSEGVGLSKRAAEQEAAKLLLIMLTTQL